MSRKQHRVYGDPRRFEVVADFVMDRFGETVEYVADVAGGKGLLTRTLSKKGNFVCELIDPRKTVLKGIASNVVEVEIVVQVEVVVEVIIVVAGVVVEPVQVAVVVVILATHFL